MTNEEAIEYLRITKACADGDDGVIALKQQMCDKAIEALETSDKAVEQAINKIASEVSEYMSCSMYRCPCVLDCNPNIRCEDRIEDWLREIVKEVEE